MLGPMSHNLSRDCAAWKMGPRSGGLVAENPLINIVLGFQIALKNCGLQVTSMDVGKVSPSVPTCVFRNVRVCIDIIL